MSEVPAKKSGGPFDFLEKGVVFAISRVFFWILCGSSFVALVAAVVICAANLIPPTKEAVTNPVYPPSVTVSLDEVNAAMAPRAETLQTGATTRSPTSQGTATGAGQRTTFHDTLVPILSAKIDTLKSYFPSKRYSWTASYERVPTGYDRWGVPRQWEQSLSNPGLQRYLDRLLDYFGNNTLKKIDVVSELTGIIAQVPEENRGKALEEYARLRPRKEDSRDQTVSTLSSTTARKRGEAEMRYASAKASKASWVQKSLRVAGVAFVSIALVGLFLCFLAIERNTRMLSALLERNRLNGPQ